MKRIADPLFSMRLVGWFVLLACGCVSSGKTLSRHDPLYRDVELVGVVSFQKPPKTPAKTSETSEAISIRTSDLPRLEHSKNELTSDDWSKDDADLTVSIGHIEDQIQELNTFRTHRQSEASPSFIKTSNSPGSTEWNTFESPSGKGADPLDVAQTHRGSAAAREGQTSFRIESEQKVSSTRPEGYESSSPFVSELGFEVMEAGIPWPNAVDSNHVSNYSESEIQTVSNRALPMVLSRPWQSDLERLIARTEVDLSSRRQSGSEGEQADYRRQQVFLRTLYLFSGRESQSLTAIPNLTPVEQEFWQQMMWTTVNSLDAQRYVNPNERASQALTPLSSAMRCLRDQADMSIKNMSFCEQISNFGNYQKFVRDEFTPGQDVLLYAEIENFRSHLTEDGEYRTSLKSVIDIIGPNGESRWNKVFAATEDRCRNPRRDYFHNYQFAIPDRLPLGPHTLTLTVVDELSGKRASYSLKFVVK